MYHKVGTLSLVTNGDRASAGFSNGDSSILQVPEMDEGQQLKLRRSM
jgi:hypothetical protein